MRAIVQRVTSASVVVDGEIVGRIDPTTQGLLVLVGVTHSDTPATAHELARKVWALRILDDEKSASDIGAPLLVISQFTLYGDTVRGRRPSWSAAAPRPVAEPLVEAVASRLRELGATVETGRFGEHMRVESVGDGPVTVSLEVTAGH
ncbi:D-tyrosyl-tRNA(Tyr) deacylase [Rhodococcus triatomae]|uniref:D-aminoacyl-tRNA deacylase n=1 Tax=Rhodococcus triatomae TaxID=300028 RepID=A0A1G8R8J7_9NOCA|nr:D-aminoacyl-tRNA deacylase [Rhodococcus triatomae]QNG19608.1 D-tyrosyl-tRNA(Tyr) deacylase [Rhodococcus triatomae]QNG24477.1 D-tyrosyl-tRNA(Tyr) deacylase [Rhodococcus triatomae]SDJ13364.1 D-tyrosyl-tRNA(Tyr) deacylase [Rhodococcus triatomae]